MKFNWKIDPKDKSLATQIVDRAFELCIKNGVPTGDKINLLMDLIATHNHDCRLDFAKLLQAPESDFMHDILGISRHLNRENGQLEDCFLPRCAQA